MRIDIYHHFDGVSTEADHKLNQIYAMLKNMAQQELIMVQEMQVLTDKVAEISTVEASAAAAITAIVAKLNTMAADATDLADMKAQALTLAQNLTDATTPLATAIATVPA